MNELREEISRLLDSVPEHNTIGEHEHLLSMIMDCVEKYLGEN